MHLFQTSEYLSRGSKVQSVGLQSSHCQYRIHLKQQQNATLKHCITTDAAAIATTTTSQVFRLKTLNVKYWE